MSVITQDEELNTFLYNRMTPHLPPVFNNKTPVGLYKDLRFLRYNPEKRSNLAPHFDGMAIREDKARSYITLHFYLNTVEEGGCTRFFDSKLGIQGKKSKEFVDFHPVQGSVLVFQQDMYHAGTEVTKGSEKYTLRASLLYN